MENLLVLFSQTDKLSNYLLDISVNYHILVQLSILVREASF